MNVVAAISKEWTRRQVMIGIMLLAGAAWFAYDGKFGWPEKNRAYDQWTSLKDDPDRELKWSKMVKANTWPSKPPTKRYDDGQIRNQFIIGGILLTGSLAAFGLLLGSRGKTVVSDEQGITNHDGHKITWASVVALDKKKWDRKSIAYAIYKDGGEEKRFMLDDFKYAGCDKMVAHLEEKLGLVTPKTAEPPAAADTTADGDAKG